MGGGDRGCKRGRAWSGYERLQEMRQSAVEDAVTRCGHTGNPASSKDVESPRPGDKDTPRTHHTVAVSGRIEVNPPGADRPSPRLFQLPRQNPVS